MGEVGGGLCLDAGALLAIERGDRRVQRLLELVWEAGGSIEVTAGVIAQTWHGGSRQARLARLLRARDITLVDLDVESARVVGVMCGASGVRDVVDGHVAFHARRRGLAVATSDPDDITRLDPALVVVEV